MPTKQIICLAYSRKLGGSCFAGIDTATGLWIRATGNYQNGALADNDCFMQDPAGGFILPNILDVIEIDFSAPEPTPAQPENWRITGSPWKRLRQAQPTDWDLLRGRVARDPTLFRGRERFIAKQEVDARPPASSLALVLPASLQWSPKTDRYGRSGYRGTFTLSGSTYDLPLTDDRYAATLADTTAARAPTNEILLPLLTISLSDLYPDTNRYYKLIAGVVVPPKSDS